ncbi:ATP-binding protein [Streptomyces sp. PTY087I2]|uniref:ATP-binding protein n=1 Tax=Streptomyces sp. PTY087I2 TaxID=1819298 RepID=UPI00159ED70E|nr:ATP-binding protein [Streptomyces sp. PTY087I2]
MVKLAPVEADVAVARRATADSLERWAVPTSLSDEARLIVSELVTNAIVHGRGRVTLRLLQHDGILRIEVNDENSTPPQMRTPSDDDVHGRGLVLVDAIAHDWGVEDEGRTTWAVLRSPAGSP